jgi:acyl dehydratase
MSLSGVAGRRYGPVPFEASRAAVAAFVAATGDDASRWSASAPPGFAAAVLFAVAPAFLDDPDVTAAGSVIHTEQEFSWHRGLPAGSVLSVEGEVTSVRERRGLNLISFRLGAALEADRWLDGAATFLMSSHATASAAEEEEPPHDARAFDRPPRPVPLPAPGNPVPEMLRSASRADLVRYAAASGDWNPIHWDHGAAVAAGLPGVVCHGLLVASWIAQAAVRHRDGDHPLASLRLRFRRPLRPAVQALIRGVAGEGGALDLSLVADDETAVSASARVTG